jgi:4-amino-4-deoxy-L-arabinose transferase-like glycosyltransferase
MVSRLMSSLAIERRGMSADRRTLLALFAIALGLRVLYGVFLAAHPDIAPPATSSELQHAKEIISGTRWITEPYSPRAPGYPVFLAAIYLVSVKQLWLVTFFQSALGALTVVVVYRLGRSILGGTLAVLAALWFASHVQHMHIGYALERGIVSVFLLILVLYLLVRPFIKMRYALIAGIVYTALVHVDPQYLLLLPVLALFVLFKTRHGYLNIQYLFLFLGTIIVASIPWTLRNYAVYGQPIPIGLEAQRYLRPAGHAVTQPMTVVPEIEGKIIRASRSRVIEENTVEFWRFARFRGSPGASDGSPGEPAWSLRHNAASIANYGLVLPFFLVGIAYALRTRNRIGLMLSAVVIAYFLVRAYLGGGEVARLPVDPLIIILGFYGLSGILRRFAPESRPEPAPPTVDRASAAA